MSGLAGLFLIFAKGSLQDKSVFVGKMCNKNGQFDFMLLETHRLNPVINT